MLNNHPALIAEEPFADVILSELSAVFARVRKHHARVRDAGYILTLFPHKRLVVYQSMQRIVMNRYYRLL